MDRQTARDTIRQQLPCKQYLEASKGGLYCCPFCNSGHGSHKTGALQLYDTNTWTCHACKKSGDIFDLIQEHYGMDYNGALNMAAMELGITIDSSNAAGSAPQSGPKAAGYDFDDSITIGAAQSAKPAEKAAEPPKADYTAYYAECAERLTYPAAVSYLTARGISLDTAKALGVGFDPAADPAHSGHPAPRIIIPSTPAHYVGRSIDEQTAKAYRKMNVAGSSPDIFNAAAIYAGNPVIYVCEGGFDAMSVCEMGKAAIATNSTSNTKRLLDQLKQKPAPDGTAFIVALDNDPDPNTAARTKAAAEALNTGLQALNYNSIVYNIAGTEKDANDLLKSDRAAFGEQLAAAEKALQQDSQQDFLADFLDKIQTEAYRPYSTGLQFFDSLLNGGIIQQSLLILMAAPGTGKTTLCQQLAEAMAANEKPVIYINLEMSREQMLAKAISYHLARRGVAFKTALDILQGYKWTAEDRATITAEIERYRANENKYLQYNPGNIGSDLDGILSYLNSVGEKAKAAGKQAPAVIVDYLHLISTGKNMDNAELIKQTVTGLKRYAVDYDTFVVGISATNRVSNASGKITMESGRDSSNLEYTGDYQLSLNYYELDNGTVKTTDTEKLAELQQQKWRRMIIRVLKGRFVQPGRSAKCQFNAASNIYYGESDLVPLGRDTWTPFDKPATKSKRY